MTTATAPARRSPAATKAEGVVRTAAATSTTSTAQGPWPGVTSITRVLDAPALTNWKIGEVAQVGGRERRAADRGPRGRQGRRGGEVPHDPVDLGDGPRLADPRQHRVDPPARARSRSTRATRTRSPGPAPGSTQQVREHGLRPLEVEAFLLHETLGYGGTLDLIAELDGEVWLLDWKTGKSVATAGRHACTPTTGSSWRRTRTPSSSPGSATRSGTPLPAITRYGIVHVTDGGTRLYEADVTERDWIAFRACLNLWDWQKNGGKAA